MVEITRTETVLFNADGDPVEVGDPAALHGESVHYDAKGNVVRRDYLRAGPPPTMGDPVHEAIEAEPGPWNLTIGDDTPVTTLNQLLVWVGATDSGDPRNLDRVAAVMLMASWENAPQSLQDEVYAYLAG